MNKKKILIIIMALIFVSVIGISVLGCNKNNKNSESEEYNASESEEYNATHTHHGVGTCTTCGLNYYNELIALIEKYGEKNADNAGSIHYEVTDLNETVDGITYLHKYALKYSTKDSVLSMFRVEQAHGTGYLVGKSFQIYLDEYGIENNSFMWTYQEYDYNKRPYTLEMSGTLNTTEFSKSTSSLHYTNSDFSASSNYTAAKNAATILKGLIENVLMDILTKSNEGITVSMLGFVRF